MLEYLWERYTMEDFGKIMLSRDLFANEHELFLGRNMYQECRLRLSLSLPARTACTRAHNDKKSESLSLSRPLFSVCSQFKFC